MGLIGRVLRYIRGSGGQGSVPEVELELSDGDRITARQFASCGDDSPPLKSDRLVVLELPGVSDAVVVGYLVPVESIAEPGERRLFARGDDGAPAMAVFLKKSGGGPGGDLPSLELGLDPSDRVTCANPAQEALDKVYEALNKLANAETGSQDGGAALQLAFRGVWGATPQSAPSVASETVKVQP